jgi:hypothetical protein
MFALDVSVSAVIIRGTMSSKHHKHSGLSHFAGTSTLRQTAKQLHCVFMRRGK